MAERGDHPSIVHRGLRAWVVLLLLIAGVEVVVHRSSEPVQDEEALRSRDERLRPRRVGPGDTPFAPNSPWRLPVPDDPRLDPRSEAIVEHLASGDATAVANVYRYGIPIWDADPDAEPEVVPCTRSEWGTCGVAGIPIRIPEDAEATDVDADGVLVVVDYERQQSYEFYEAERIAGSWRATWGAAIDLRGDGVGDRQNSVTGAGVSRLAGVVRVAELEAAAIEHALVFSTDNACRDDFRYPASKTDGRSGRADCIPEGSRIQLDPDVDVDGMSELTHVERVVARAMQVYGAYAIDNGGARMAFSFERPREHDPYPELGIERDYRRLDGIPWERLRVLRSWDGR